MSPAIFRQADIERIIRAARNTGSIVQVDLRSLIVTVLPGAMSTSSASPLDPALGLGPDGQPLWGEENWEGKELDPRDSRAMKRNREY